MKILGVAIHTVTKKQIRRKIEKFLRGNVQKMIFTPNPEMLVRAYKDSYFRDVLNDAHLNICDGYGIKLVTRGKVNNIPGSDIFYDICRIAEEKNKSIYLLGSGKKEIVKQAKINIAKRFPQLRIVGIHEGPQIKFSKTAYGNILELSEAHNEKIIDDIIDCSPDVLFVGFGHEKQEKWIYKYLRDIPSVRIAIGVGGTFDFVSEKVKRAPVLLRKLGLEWLFRLVREPKRIGRICTAVILFPYLYNKSRKK
jgi:N-acetylglucosaminyldiphosphoundecaprenol N-acetyl-beta-D-mannosaminyltransferase